jgi:hypothetical protein
MRLSRTGCGVVAAGVAGVTLVVVGPLEDRFTGDTFSLRDAPETSADDVPRPALTPTTRVNERREQIADFMRRIMNLDADRYFLSDETTVSDLHPDADHHDDVTRTFAAYGVDISDIVPPYLWAIAKRIQEREAR